MDIDEIKKVKAEADCLFTKAEVEAALDSMAMVISEKLQHKNPLVLCVMSGAMIPAGHLLTRLDFPLQLDYIHASRYAGETRGGELYWQTKPNFSLSGREVLIIDDILDEGITLAAIVEYCHEAGAASVSTAVLVDKKHDRKNGINADFVGLETEDRYLFGYGMDYKDYLRNAAGIYAVKGL